MNKLIETRLIKKPAKNGYHPNVAPFKVIVHPMMSESYIKREYTNKEKAERYAMELSKKYKNTRITIEYIKISKSE
jgi:hypothetical protein